MGGIRGVPNPIRQVVETQLGWTAGLQDRPLAADHQFDDFPLALPAQKRRCGLAPVATVTMICRTTFWRSGAGCIRDGSRGVRVRVLRGDGHRLSSAEGSSIS